MKLQLHLKKDTITKSVWIRQNFLEHRSVEQNIYKQILLKREYGFRGVLSLFNVLFLGTKNKCSPQQKTVKTAVVLWEINFVKTERG